MTFKFLILTVFILSIVSSIHAKDKKDKKDKKNDNFSMAKISKIENADAFMYKSFQECVTELRLDITDKKAMEENKHCTGFCAFKKIVLGDKVGMDGITEFAKTNLTDAAQGPFLNATNACLTKKGLTANQLSQLATDYTEASCKAWKPVMKCTKKGVKKAIKAVENASSSTMAPPANNEAQNNDDDDDDDDDENTK